MATRPGTGWGGLLGFSLLCAGTVADRANATEPMEIIRTSNSRIAEVVKPGRPLTKAEAALVFEIIEAITDFPTVARNAVGPAWESVPEDQQREFVATFGRLIGTSSIKKMGPYRADRVVYLSQHVDGDQATVKTQVSYKDKRVPLDYLLMRIDGQWKIVSFVFDGVDNVQNYRRQFDKLLKKQSFPELIVRLKRRLLAESE